MRPERRTALVAKELQRYRIEIAALSETRLADEGSLKEEGGGYTFFWKGKPQAEDRIHGVGFAIRITLLKNTPALPVAINERVMKVRIPLSKIRYLTVVSAYAPTLTSPDETKEQFYDQFDQVIRSTPPSDKLIIFGDFNARVGKDHNSWEGILGRHGVGKVNNNGLLLLSKCAQHSLCITNTFFRMADKYKTTWMHPRSKHWHMIDFIIVRQRDIEQNMPLYSVFIDLAKAFDSVNREALWVVLESTGCPPKFISMIRLFHNGMIGQVLSSGNVTKAFAISNGVKQGYVLAPVLFNVFFTCMLSHAVRDLEKGVYIRYRLDGSLFDLRRLTAKTKSLQALLQVVLFTDDCALVAHTETDLQRMMDRFSDASKLFGVTVSLGNTKVLHQPAPNTHPPAPTIIIDDTTFSNVEHFKYLGSTISCDGSLDKELGTRISKASQALGRLRNRVFNQHNITLSTKLKVYNAVVLTSLLYGCETWTLYRRHVKKLEYFHMRALRHTRYLLAGPSYQLRGTGPFQLYQHRVHAPHGPTPMSGACHPHGGVPDSRRLMYGELQLGKRNQGRPKLRYKDTVKANLQWCHIKPRELEERAMDRPVWRASIHKAASNFEEARSQKLTAARERCHKAPSAVITTTDFQCPHCSRLCASRLGLQSHLRVHR